MKNNIFAVFIIIFFSTGHCNASIDDTCKLDEKSWLQLNEVPITLTPYKLLAIQGVSITQSNLKEVVFILKGLQKGKKVKKSLKLLKEFLNPKMGGKTVRSIIDELRREERILKKAIEESLPLKKQNEDVERLEIVQDTINTIKGLTYFGDHTLFIKKVFSVKSLGSMNPPTIDEETSKIYNFAQNQEDVSFIGINLKYANSTKNQG